MPATSRFAFIVFVLLGMGAAGCHRDGCLPMCQTRARELGCRHPEECEASCDKLHGSPICIADFKTFEACFLKEPRDHWKCDDDGQPAVADGICTPERDKVLACLQSTPMPSTPPAKKP